MPDGEPRLNDIYGRYASSARRRRAWSADNRGNQAVRDELVAAITARANLAAGEILDAGCGTGWLLERLSRGGVTPSRLNGVEALAQRVDAARRRAPGATVLHADAAHLPFADGRFALVTLLTVLSSASTRAEQERILAEAIRVTAPDGLVAVWEPRYPNPRNRATRSSLGAIASVSGVAAERRSVTLVPPVARSLGRATPWLYPRLAAIPPLRSHVLVFMTPT